MQNGRTGLTRRELVGGTAAALAGISIVPRHVLAGGDQTAPSEKLNIAAIGAGGQAVWDLDNLSGENIVALCDADLRTCKDTFKKYPKAKQYRDFRKMLAELDKEIDAVLVATPDHTHAVAAMAAVKRGKHVYCEKPLAHSVWEVRQLMTAAREHKVVTQLGNQGHSFDTIRQFCEWIWDGAIGKVHTIHAACDAFPAAYSKIGRLDSLKKRHEIPAELDWDLWLGPAADRPYHPAYLPFEWRGWSPFGTGVLGDWVCHVLDPVFWALDLGAPRTIQVDKAVDYDVEKHALTFPKGIVVRYDFAASDKHGPITLYWHGGSERIPRPEGMDKGVNPPGTGAVVLGDKGGITYGSHGAGGLQIYPQDKMKAYKQPPQKLPRVKGHHQDWLDAIRKGTKAGSDWSYGGPLTELGLLGVIGLHFPGQELKWDGPAMRFTNNDEATRMLTPKYREGWKL
ncbi:MAG: Gfo/Idh/MocA family oxidoreductase [Phycisphaerae bacterium]|nr:Gfo/Idh/MocA family oxidoreductase [Phycisphaerae bacterium]